MSDSRIVNVHIVASMSADRLRDFLQNLRDFDMKHNAEIPFEAVVHAKTMTDTEIEAIYKSIKPPMPYMGKARWAEPMRWTEDKSS